MERLARFQAYKLDGSELNVRWVEPLGNGYLIRSAHPLDPTRLMDIYARPPFKTPGQKIRLKYHPEPEVAMITMLGQPRYRLDPSSYLTVAH